MDYDCICELKMVDDDRRRHSHCCMIWNDRKSKPKTGIERHWQERMEADKALEILQKLGLDRP